MAVPNSKRVPPPVTPTFQRAFQVGEEVYTKESLLVFNDDTRESTELPPNHLVTITLVNVPGGTGDTQLTPTAENASYAFRASFWGREYHEEVGTQVTSARARYMDLSETIGGPPLETKILQANSFAYLIRDFVYNTRGQKITIPKRTKVKIMQDPESQKSSTTPKKATEAYYYVAPVTRQRTMIPVHRASHQVVPHDKFKRKL